MQQKAKNQKPKKPTSHLEKFLIFCTPALDTIHRKQTKLRWPTRTNRVIVLSQRIIIQLNKYSTCSINLHACKKNCTSGQLVIKLMESFGAGLGLINLKGQADPRELAKGPWQIGPWDP